MSRKQFVQDTAQKILLSHLQVRSVSPEQSKKLVSNIVRMSAELAAELEAVDAGWQPQSQPPQPRPTSTEVQCHACLVSGGTREQVCLVCGGTGKLSIDMPPRRP
ncbi:hypothetical protein [Aeromonas phage PVN02]|nr:hypothetical protein [Aeromonas phage PVN02]CAC9972294.1 hypothetical protein PVN02_00027 [Aeromonas phage PVN02]